MEHLFRSSNRMVSFGSQFAASFTPARTEMTNASHERSLHDANDYSWKQLLGPIFFASLPYLVSLQGLPPFSFDGMIYRVWTESFHGQLFGGVPYPRWMPDLNRGLGSPTFYFYPPVAFFLSALFRALGFGLISVDVSMGLAILSAALLGATGAFLVSRELGARRADAALIAVVYTQLPYLFYANLVVRGAFVEFIACGVYPLLLWSAMLTRSRGIKGAPWLAVFVATMLMLHPPTALIAIPTSIFLALALRDGSELRWLAIASSVGALIASWYLSTALTHQEYAPHETMFRAETVRHSLFLRLSVLSDTKRDFGDHMLNVLSISNQLILPAFLITALPVLAIVAWAIRRNHTGDVKPKVLLVLVVLVLYLCHPYSQPLWDSFPLINRIQFAWRLTSTLTVLVPLSLAMLVAAPAPMHNFRLRVLSRMTVSAAALTAINFAFAVYIFPMPQQDGHYELARNDVIEHRLSGPVEAYSDSSIVFSLDGAKVYNAEFRRGRARALVSAPSEGATVVLRQFPYTGWSVTVDGDRATLHDPESKLVSVRVPPGTSSVEFRLVRTALEFWGLVASALGAASLVLLFLWRSRWEISRQHAS